MAHIRALARSLKHCSAAFNRNIGNHELSGAAPMYGRVGLVFAFTVSHNYPDNHYQSRSTILHTSITSILRMIFIAQRPTIKKNTACISTIHALNFFLLFKSY